MKAGSRRTHWFEIRRSGQSFLLLPLTHSGASCLHCFHNRQNRRHRAGPYLSAYAHPQSIVVSGRCWLTHRSTILWCLCADNAIYWPHKSAGFFTKGRGGEGWWWWVGDFEQQINEIKKWRRCGRGSGMGWGCANFSRWHCEAVIETEVVSLKSRRSSLNWNVTITVGVISYSLTGPHVYVHIRFQILSKGVTKRRTHVALTNCLLSECIIFYLFIYFLNPRRNNWYHNISLVKSHNWPQSVKGSHRQIS